MNKITKKFKAKNVTFLRDEATNNIIALNDDGTIIDEEEFNKLWKALGFLIRFLINIFL
tara:strand:- start:480 stop:656 length:177 start_codon:yes stop_codon:yes gene_type:complete